MLAGSYGFGLLTGAGAGAGWLLASLLGRGGVPPGDWAAAIEALVLAGGLTALAACSRGLAARPAGPVGALAQLLALTAATAMLSPAAGRWAVAFAIAASLAVGEFTRHGRTRTILLAWGLVLGVGGCILLAGGAPPA